MENEREMGVGGRIVDPNGIGMKIQGTFPISEVEMLERREESDRLISSCRVLLRQPTVCGRVLWGEAKSNECTEKRKRDFVQSTSQNYGEAAWGAGAGIAPVILLAIRKITEFRDLPRLCSKYVVAVAWISLQKK